MPSSTQQQGPTPKKKSSSTTNVRRPKSSNSTNPSLQNLSSSTPRPGSMPSGLRSAPGSRPGTSNSSTRPLSSGPRNNNHGHSQSLGQNHGYGLGGNVSNFDSNNNSVSNFGGYESSGSTISNNRSKGRRNRRSRNIQEDDYNSDYYNNNNNNSNNGSINKGNNKTKNNNYNSTNGQDNESDEARAAAKAALTTATGTKKLDETAKYYLNYGVLALHDSKLGQIFFTTTVCNIYIFDSETEEWNKSYCQGPLFLYSRVVTPQDQENAKIKSLDKNEGEEDDDDGTHKSNIDYGSFAPYALIALNRLSPDNFSLAVTPKSIAKKHGVDTVSIYRDGDFLIVQSPDDVTYCIYLYKDEERQSILDGVEWCLNVDM